jgi:hypothetical protein
VIRKLRARKWTAVKVTQYGHGICSNEGKQCECAGTGEDPEHPFALSEEYEASGTDSGRFLAAGAERSFWLRTPSGELSRASRVIEKILAQNTNVIMESNSVLELVQPDVFLMVLDFGCEDFKPSSARFLDRADAFVVIDRGINVPLWAEVARGLWDGKPQFIVTPRQYVSKELIEFIGQRETVRVRP